MTPAQARAMSNIERCRTAAMGGHLDVCTSCGFSRPAYNSCRDRHCPSCQSLAQARWILERKERILPVKHFHVVFTLPEELRALARANPRVVYAILMRSATRTLQKFGRDPQWIGGQIGVTAVLHTWTRDLRLHPHVHCIVTAGGLSSDGRSWIAAKGNDRFLFPVHALSKVFRGTFMNALEQAQSAGQLHDSGRLVLSDEGFGVIARSAVQSNWVVYSKRPFGRAEHIYEYLGRYTHRVGISNQRLLRMNDDGSVLFRTRGKKKATLAGVEFIRRFLEHVLPSGFVKIRHTGLYASSNVPTRLKAARTALAPSETSGPPVPIPTDWHELFQELTGIDLRRCPNCLAQLVAEPLPIDSTVLDSAPPPS